MFCAIIHEETEEEKGNLVFLREGRPDGIEEPMNGIIVQIYEIQEAREVRPLIEAGVDHVGTVIDSPDDPPWPYLLKTVKAVQAEGKKSVIIPLFSDLFAIFHALSYFQPDFVHFCEAISPSSGGLAGPLSRLPNLVRIQAEVKEKFPSLGIIRSIGLPRPGRTSRELAGHIEEVIGTLAPYTDFFLLDTLQEGEQPVSGFVGITGEICDWALAREIVDLSPRPVILAGGLGPDNVAEAIRYVRPAGVDSCTRTNVLDERGRPLRFRKDMKLVSLFVREARRMEKVLSYL